MSASAPSSSLLIFVALLLFLEMGTSCSPKHKGLHYSLYQVVGTSRLTVFIDSRMADQATTDNTLYLELMTAKDTFFVKPIAQTLSFPRLKDSLTQVNIYHKNWYCEIGGIILQKEYRAFYFPGQAATIVLDTYPFEHPKAKRMLKQQKKRIYYEIRFQDSDQYFITSLTQDKWGPQE